MKDGAGARLALWARWARLTAAALFAILSLTVLAATAPGALATEAETAPRPRPLPPSPVASQPAQAESDLPATPPPTSPTAELPSLPSPRQILIDLGPPRSEVFVDGRKVGQTPFLGQVKCRPGREIKIQIVPERGLPFEERRLCPP